MKSTLVVMATLLAMVAFVSGVMAQAPAKTEKPKSEDPRQMRFGGEVVAYEPGKMIKVKRSDGKEMTFDMTGATQINGGVKESAKVSVIYKRVGNKLVANTIIVAPEGGLFPGKKVSGEKAEETPEKK